MKAEILQIVKQIRNRLLRICVDEDCLPEPNEWPELHRICSKELADAKNEADDKVQKNLELTRKVI